MVETEGWDCRRPRLPGIGQQAGGGCMRSHQIVSLRVE